MPCNLSCGVECRCAGGRRIRGCEKRLLPSSGTRKRTAGGSWRTFAGLQLSGFSLSSAGYRSCPRGWQSGGGDLLQRLPQHELHHNAAATAGSDLGSRSKQDEGDFWRGYSRRQHEENHPLSSSSLYGREPQTLKFGTGSVFGSCSIVAPAEQRG